MSTKKRDKVVAERPVGEYDAEIRVLIGELSQQDGPVLRCLQRVHEHFGYVPESGIAVIAELCNVSRAETYGVLTYYSDLRTTPAATVTVRLCAAEACQSVGSRELEKQWHERHLRDFSETGTNSVETQQVFCLGNCALGPAAMVNGELVGRADVDAIAELVRAGLEREVGTP